MATNKEDNALTPSEHTGLKLGERKEIAAGVPAITNSFKHILKEMGLTRGLHVLGRMNQKGGFDCPSCAWPDPDGHRSGIAEYCENGAKAIAEEATTKKADLDFWAKYTVTELGKQSDYWLGKVGRITHPMVLNTETDKYEPIEWEAAFELIANELNNLTSPNEAVFYTSGRASNEAAFLYQLFVREFGTNNLPDCSNMCHESSGSALSPTIGIGKGSVTLEDIHQAELLIIMGQNPGTNHPRMLTALQKNKKNGGKIISINPLPETGLMGFRHPQHPTEWVGKGTDLSDLFLQVRINGDVALLKGILKLLYDEEQKNPGKVFDHDFIKKQTSGYDDFIAGIAKVDVEEMAKDCGISVTQMKTAADMIKDKKNIIICWAMGITQHTNGVNNIKEIVNLLLVKGSIGKPGAGVCPVRGHSNVQGDRTVGIWERPKPEFLEKLEKVFGFTPPKAHGYDAVDCIKAMHEEKAKVFFALGGNFISATPDTAFTAEALRKCNLTVHVSTKPNRSHVVHGKKALILPCLVRSERDMQKGNKQFVSIENSMGVVQSSEGDLPAISRHLKSESAIVAELAKATLKGKTKVDWDSMIANYDNIRSKIEAVVPGFENYNERVRQPGGFYLPNNARDQDFRKIGGTAKFSVVPLPEHKLKENEYVMMTIRSHDQYNTTIYGLDDRYRGVYNERRVVFINEKDMADANLKSGDIVDLVNSEYGKRRVADRFIVVPYSIPPKCVATYFPETNVLVPIENVAKESNTPVSKYVKITIEKNK